MTTPINDPELCHLLAGCRKNDTECQQKLYKRFYGFAMSRCLRYSGNRYEASEILNDGFMKVFARISQYVDTKPFQSWLGRIMTNTAIDHYRAELRHSRTTDLSGMDDIGHDPSAEQLLNYQDLLNIIRALPPSYRAVFNLFAIDGFSHEEISKMVGISVGTSKSHLFKARQKLQKWVSLSVAEQRQKSKEPGKIIPLPVRNNPRQGLASMGE